MTNGTLVVYVECLACRHVGEIDKAEIDRRFGNVLFANSQAAAPLFAVRDAWAGGGPLGLVGWWRGTEGRRERSAAAGRVDDSGHFQFPPRAQGGG